MILCDLYANQPFSNIMDNFKKFQQEYGVDGDIDM